MQKKGIAIHLELHYTFRIIINIKLIIIRKKKR